MGLSWDRNVFKDVSAFYCKKIHRERVIMEDDLISCFPSFSSNKQRKIPDLIIWRGLPPSQPSLPHFSSFPFLRNVEKPKGFIPKMYVIRASKEEVFRRLPIGLT